MLGDKALVVNQPSTNTTRDAAPSVPPHIRDFTTARIGGKVMLPGVRNWHGNCLEWHRRAGD
jgi:hypothetical protein